ncbi:MAG: hypothetical protein WKF59_16680 [Chitinophagaceae bacterium]
MKQKDSLLIVDKYDYKGQQWFSMRRMLTLKESQMSDRMYHQEFYNKDCKLVCTLTKGGIAGLNKVLPDTIDKTKIIKVGGKVPENIMQLAIKYNGISISIYEYLGQPLYLLKFQYSRLHNPKQIIRESYYDKNGIEKISYKRATDPAFSRQEGWEPSDVQPEKIISKSVIWYNPYYRQMKW